MSPLIIYIVVPLVGILFYILLLCSIHPVALRRNVSMPLFLLFTHGGGLLLVILSAVSDTWSGMATIGFFYLVSIGLLVMGGLAWYLYLHRSDHAWYGYLFGGCMAYFAVLLLCFTVTFSNR